MSGPRNIDTDEILARAKTSRVITLGEFSALVGSFSLGRRYLDIRASVIELNQMLNELDITIVSGRKERELSNSHSSLVTATPSPKPVAKVREIPKIKLAEPTTKDAENEEILLPDLDDESAEIDDKEWRDLTDSRDSMEIYGQQMSKYQVLTREEERKLCERIAAGDAEARDLMILHNWRLVLWIARKYRHTSLEFADLVQEGNIGLMCAVEKYSLSHEVKFSTYAFHWVKQAIWRAIENTGNTIRIPVHMLEQVRKVARTTEELARESGGMIPTDDQVAERAGVSVISVQSAQRANRVRALTSLDQPLGDDRDSGVIGDFLSSDATASARDRLASIDALEDAKSELRNILHTLENVRSRDRDRDIFKRFYRLDGSSNESSKVTLDSLGHEYNITRERVRQINEMVWQKLKRKGIKLDHDSLRDLIRRKIPDLESLIGEDTDDPPPRSK